MRESRARTRTTARPRRVLARRHLQALSRPGMATGRPAPPSFLVTGIADTRDGVLFRVQRLQRGPGRVPTDDVRVLHLDQVAIQITRGGVFYVREPRPGARQPVLHRLEIRRERAGTWTVRAVDLPGANAAIEALPAFPILGFVRAPLARDAVERTWPPRDLSDAVV